MNPADELAPYPSPEGRAAETADLTARVGGELVEYGTSIEGRPLVAVRVPSTLSDRPRILCGANIHGVEFIAGRVALGLLRALADGDPRLVELRARAELWVVPSINPDGYARTFAAGGHGRLPNFRANAHGVDLNRNYPRPGGAAPSWLPGAGSDRPGDATYRGPHPLSEPETAALDRLFSAQRFVAGANLHSFMGTVIPARVTERRAYATYRRLCRSFARAQPHRRYFRLASRIFDTFTGEQEDHQHHAHGTWAVCVETFTILASYRQHLRAPSVFWRFNPRDPAPWVENDVSGLCAYFGAALQLERPGNYDRRA
ncbi:M14 family metallopeptidase [Nannocystis radixulma]|uniref:M14 family metallopeptidase n=1 Tax=Nannocystis radixulma TaxID=2995305 RepID=A0ABT5B095_9BACT|nr:M14 family metallopeptidase [Nannocystis radixulma]MDC0667513.1 M14 family metallopeptidase [Nannocystis radixulma]